MSGESNLPGSGNGASQGEPADGQRYATLEEVQRLVDLATRRSQSMGDKQESRVTKLVRERTDAIERAIQELKDNGQTVPDSVAQRLREDAYDDAVRTHVQNGGDVDAELAAYLRRGSSEIWKEHGVTIDPKDPADAEYVAMVSTDASTSPKAFLSQLEKAAAAKAAKLNGRKPNMSEPQSTNKPSGIATGGGIPSLGGGANTSPKPNTTLQEQYKAELAEAIKSPTYNREQGARIRRKYREQGLLI